MSIVYVIIKNNRIVKAFPDGMHEQAIKYYIDTKRFTKDLILDTARLEEK